jgi:hypothetical protein
MNISWHDRDLYPSLCLLAGLAIMESESGVSFIFLNACSAEIALGPTKARSSAALVLLKVRTLPRRLRIPSRFPSPVSHSEKISNRYEIVIRNIAAVGVLWIARAADGWGGFLFRIRRANVRASQAGSKRAPVQTSPPAWICLPEV